jgi:hypothetical protein
MCPVRDGWFAEVPLEMARHQERVAQSSATPRMQDALTALEPLNGRIAPNIAVQPSGLRIPL